MWPWLWLAIIILAAMPWALWCGGRRENGVSLRIGRLFMSIDQSWDA